MTLLLATVFPKGGDLKGEKFPKAKHQSTWSQTVTPKLVRPNSTRGKQSWTYDWETPVLVMTQACLGLRGGGGGCDTVLQGLQGNPVHVLRCCTAQILLYLCSSDLRLCCEG